MRGAGPRKAQKTKSAQYEDLGKLGKYLSASDVGGNARERAKVSKQRQASLVDTYRASVGGGQSRTNPIKPKKDKSSPKMNAQQRRESFIGTNPVDSRPYAGTWNVGAKKLGGSSQTAKKAASKPTAARIKKV